MAVQAGILARGPWRPSDVEVTWHAEPFQPPRAVIEEADRALAALRGRGSPSHDGLAGRLRDYRSENGRLRLECEPIRWALRLLPGNAMQSLSALCLVRSADGRWLAGRRAAWLATWAERWALGAAGSVEVDENPADTLVRELREEWSVSPERMTVEVLLGMPNGIAMLVGMAWLAPEAQVTPDEEHDDFDWWPADPEQWPDHADAPLRRIAALLSTPP
jgi:ADP-ribose pyrophosphatase YjhB (NUDIX family)